MKKSGNSIFSVIAFVLFVVWGIGTLANVILSLAGQTLPFQGIVESILRICSIIVMLYCAFLFYESHKSNKVVFWLFWISVIVAIAVVVLYFI